MANLITLITALGAIITPIAIAWLGAQQKNANTVKARRLEQMHEQTMQRLNNVRS